MLNPHTTDASGVFGGILHYSLVFFLVGGALLAFLYFWRKGRLDMDEEPKYDMMKEDDHVELYGDAQIASAHNKVPWWLIVNYIVWPLWGIIWFYLYWNGSWGWLDRGSWKELQTAAKTTFPHEKSH